MTWKDMLLSEKVEAIHQRLVALEGREREQSRLTGSHDAPDADEQRALVLSYIERFRDGTGIDWSAVETVFDVIEPMLCERHDALKKDYTRRNSNALKSTALDELCEMIEMHLHAPEYELNDLPDAYVKWKKKHEADSE